MQCAQYASRSARGASGFCKGAYTCYLGWDRADCSQLCTSLGAAAHASVYQQAMLIAINARALVLENMLRRTEMSIAQLKAAAAHKTDLEEAQKVCARHHLYHRFLISLQTEMGLICRRVVWNAKRFDFSNESIAGDAWVSSACSNCDPADTFNRNFLKRARTRTTGSRSLRRGARRPSRRTRTTP